MSEPVRSLTELLEKASSRRFIEAPAPEDLGRAEPLAFPFLSIVGQKEMKLALMLAIINPNIGGVLLIGTRGTGKSTAVRSLAELLPEVQRSRCTYGCMPEDVETGGMDAVCPECARRYASGEPLTYLDRAHLIELPLNALLEDVVGGLDERASLDGRIRIRRGILSKADRNLLYVDEINLLQDDIVDAILDAASQGNYTLHRGHQVATYRSRFVLIGSMNPEEGLLRPQILDRLGLRVVVKGLSKRAERLDAYRRSVAYKTSPRALIQSYTEPTELLKQEIAAARQLMHEVHLTSAAETYGLKLIQELGIDSLRADITLLEAARAYAVADGRDKASPADVRKVAPLALRLRRSGMLQDTFVSLEKEEKEIEKMLASLQRKKPARRKKSAAKRT